MMQDEPNLSLFEVSSRLGVSPSAIKKRVAQLGLPVQRGARGKLIFDRHAYALLVEADRLLKAGHGFEECRRELGLGGPVHLTVVPEVESEAEPAAVEMPNEAGTEEAESPVEVPEEHLTPTEEFQPPLEETSSPVMDSSSAVADLAVSEAPAQLPVPVEAPAATDEGVRPLPPPIFVQLGRKQRTVNTVPPDLLARLDAALKMLEEKERHNQMLQAKLLVAYDEMTKLSATAAAFQERSLNLAHEVQKLQGELKMLEAPGKRRPWWKFWGK